MFAIGEWLISAPEGTEIITEQELRRYDPEFYPPWVPKSSDHRPDGYWALSVGERKKVIAIEVELSSQRHQRYREISEFYRRETGIVSVLWLVSSPAKATIIHEIMNKGTAHNQGFHNLITVKPFKELGWCCPILYGPDQGKTVFDVLQITTKQRPNNYLMPLFLNTQINPYRSPGYKKPA